MGVHNRVSTPSGSTNHQKASYLRAIADYVELADEGAEVSVGFRLHLKGDPIFHRVSDIDSAGIKLSAVAAKKLADFIQVVQDQTGTDQGQDIKTVMESYMGDLTKSGYLR